MLFGFTRPSNTVYKNARRMYDTFNKSQLPRRYIYAYVERTRSRKFTFARECSTFFVAPAQSSPHSHQKQRNLSLILRKVTEFITTVLRRTFFSKSSARYFYYTFPVVRRTSVKRVSSGIPRMSVEVLSVLRKICYIPGPSRSNG